LTLRGIKYAASVVVSPHAEHHRQITNGWARAAVFGASDGLVTNVSLILGFAGAQPGHTVVRLAGIAGLVSGAFSMAAGEYLSMQSQRELIEREVDVERRSLAEFPAAEQEELLAIFLERGIEPDFARRMSEELMKDPDMALRTHTREELGIDPSNVGSPVRAALGSFVSFCLGAMIPLLPWLLTSSGNPVWWSVGLGAVGTSIVGGIVGWFTQRGIIRGALRQLLITAIAAGVTFGVGRGVGSTA
jgi:vacuolar iron transporter family protein